MAKNPTAEDGERAGWFLPAVFVGGLVAFGWLREWTMNREIEQRTRDRLKPKR